MIIIKLIQEHLGKTQQQIADDLSVSRQTISMWISGYKISKKNIDKISEVYKIPTYLIEKTQQTGISLTEDDFNKIKDYLLNGYSTSSLNFSVIHKLFTIIGNPNIIKSSNYNEFINNICTSESCYLKSFKLQYAEKEIKNNCIVLVSKIDYDLIEILTMLNKVNKKFAYIIFEKNNSNLVDIVYFGGEDEINN